MMNYTLEVIAFSIESCVLAQSAGAHRIELCDNPGDGGTTPSYGFIQTARKKTTLELFPIIRPRGGDFLYSDDEFEIMKQDIIVCRQSGCDGIVTGLLHADGTVDKLRTAQLVALAYPMSVTFHRAFDRTQNAFEAMEDIIETGCERILTSGQKPAATDALDFIAELIRRAEERIIIMPGSGIRSDNIRIVAKQTGATEFHSSARRSQQTHMKFIQASMNEQLKSTLLDEDEVKNMIAQLSSVHP